MKNLQRIIIVCLICSLFLGYACMPVNATPAAFAGYSALYSLFVQDFAVVMAEELAPTISKIFNSLSKPLQNILIQKEQYEQMVLDGDFMKAYCLIMVDILKNNPFVVHRVKQNADSLTTGDLVSAGTTIQIQQIPLTNEQLEVIATETTRTKNLIRSLLEEIQVLKYDLTEYISHIPTSLTALRNQVIEGFDSLSLTLQTFRQNFVDKIIDVQSVISEFRAAVNDRFSTLQSALGAKLNDVNIHLHAMRETLTTRLASIDGLFDIKLSDIKTVVSTFRTQFVEKIGSLQTTLSTFRTQFVEKIDDIRSVIGDVRAELIKNITVGINDIKVAINDLSTSLSHGLTIAISGTPSFDSGNEDNKQVGIGGGLAWFGHSNDILGQYGVGLLAAGAILKQFTDMPFFSSLITVSLSIGLVSVFFGIIMNAAQSDGSKSTRPGHSSGNRAKNGG